MIPNFQGSYEYNPKMNPIKDLSQEEINDFCFAYMAMWLDQGGFSDFNIMYEAGDNGMCADWLVGAGAIDSDACYDHCKAIEQVIECWAKEFRKTPLRRAKAYEKVFKNCTVQACKDCNHVQFLNNGNENAYADQLSTCWECSSKNVTIRKWEE